MWRTPDLGVSAAICWPKSRQRLSIYSQAWASTTASGVKRAPTILTGRL
jgi:hypothetical protein